MVYQSEIGNFCVFDWNVKKKLKYNNRKFFTINLRVIVPFLLEINADLCCNILDNGLTEIMD